MTLLGLALCDFTGLAIDYSDLGFKKQAWNENEPRTDWTAFGCFGVWYDFFGSLHCVTLLLI